MHFLDRLNTIEKRLYQLIISRLEGENVRSHPYRERIFRLVSEGIGGFIVFGGEGGEIKAFIDEIQSRSEVPLFIASDIERGVGQQMKGYTRFPCQMAVHAAINKGRPEEVALLREAVGAIAREAIDAGINLPLIPVLDVNRNPDNPIICTRAFSEDPVEVSWFGSEYIKVLEASGLISCAKHFPGHGDTSTDSHIALPRIDKPLRDLMSVDILPFKEAIKAGVGSIMVGHLHVPHLDSLPASLSRRVITNLLREELGFERLVLTDALNMAALSGYDNVPALCIEAGNDMLLHPADPDLTVEELISAIRSGRIKEESIDAPIGRIMKAKMRLQHIKKGEVDYGHHQALSGRITDMSITLAKRKEGILPLTEDSKVDIVIAGEGKFFKPFLWKRHFKNLCSISNHPEPDGKITIFAIFTETAAWRGSSGIGEEEVRQITGLIRIAKGSIVISFGSPYVLRHFREADILVAAYEASEEAQSAVLRKLKRINHEPGAHKGE